VEDPLAEEDVEGWRKLLLKFKDSKVELGSRRLYSNMKKLKHVFNLNLKNYDEILFILNSGLILQVFNEII